jgi:hypothetical protein
LQNEAQVSSADSSWLGASASAMARTARHLHVSCHISALSDLSISHHPPHHQR